MNVFVNSVYYIYIYIETYFTEKKKMSRDIIMGRPRGQCSAIITPPQGMKRCTPLLFFFMVFFLFRLKFVHTNNTNDDKISSSFAVTNR